MDEERQAYSVDELLRILPIGRSSAYKAVARREIPSVRVAGRILIPKIAIQRILESAAPAASQDEQAHA